MQAVINELKVEKDELEEFMIAHTRASGVDTVGKLFEKAGAVSSPKGSPTMVLPHGLQHLGLIASMDVSAFYYLLSDLGSVNKLGFNAVQKAQLTRILSDAYRAYKKTQQDEIK